MSRTNPFDDDHGSGSGGGSRSSSTNPFDGPSPSSSSGGRGGSTTRSSHGNTNPFDDGGGGPGSTSSTRRSSRTSNPFDDDAEPPSSRYVGGSSSGGTRRGFLGGGGSGNTNPFDTTNDVGGTSGERSSGGYSFNQFGSRAAGFVGNALQRPKVLGRVRRARTGAEKSFDEDDSNSPASFLDVASSITDTRSETTRGSKSSFNPFDDDVAEGGGGTTTTTIRSSSNPTTMIGQQDDTIGRHSTSISKQQQSNNVGTGTTTTTTTKKQGRKQARRERKLQQQQQQQSTNQTGGGGGAGGGGQKKGLGLRGGRGGKQGGPANAWPFDDFNEMSGGTSQYLAMNSNTDGGDGGGDQADQLDPLMMNMGIHQSINTAAAELGEDMQKEFERPADLPTISEAVRDLSLVDFERKAEERAIRILGMWLHDSGLIDDLLVAGTPGYTSLAKRTRVDAGYVDDMTVVSSRTSEGMEVGAVTGLPLETMKMDKEITWLRNRVQRELTLVNSRLNDGVAASGSEVQELVNSVAGTKGDLGRLRQILMYITQSDTKQRDEFLLQNCPRLRQVMNARRNLFRCFRELDFFDQMPVTCERLREELHASEWTTDEWTTIRNVSMEHVELEILLVEAEAGMKDLVDQNEGGNGNGSGTGRGKRGGGFTRQSSGYRSNRALVHPDMVDRFLNPHVTNVWELGEEIKLRITAGLNTAYELASNNPSAMVALVEAVEVYERATEHYQSLSDPATKHRSGGNLKFTNMRASALATLCEHFTLRCSEVFRKVQMRAADMADEENAGDQEFAAILQAATELVSELNFVKEEVAPCFAPHWRVEVLWSSSIAHICSNQIIQQIGGPEGTALCDLSTSQVLDLISWIEFFREHIEEAFPRVAELRASRKTYFDEKPELLKGELKKEVDMDNATDSLAWANNMLWEIRRVAEGEFLQRTRDQVNDWLDNVYSAEHTNNETSEGRLTTSLSEDLFSLVNIQLRTLREHLSPSSEALVMTIGLVFSNLRQKQILCRNNFLHDLESACAAANDFSRMTELAEDTVSEMFRECNFDDDIRNSLDASLNDLLSLYSADSVYAAQSTHVYIFEPIHDAIAAELFGVEWEENLTHNELALTLVRTIEDFMEDLEQYLDSFLMLKTMEALVAAAVVFYVRCLLVRAEEHNNARVGFFKDNSTALERMTGDIKIMRDFFDGLTETMPTLSRVIEKEFEFFVSFHELLSIAAGQSESEASNFVIVVHKLLMGNIDLTKHFVGDIWHLMNPSEEKELWELIDNMEETLEAIAPKNEEAIRQAMDRQQVPGLRLDRMMAELYVESTRKLPIKTATLQKMVQNLRLDWGGGGVADRAATN